MNSADLLFQILVVVRKLADEQPQFTKEGPLISKGGPVKRLTVSVVYDWIKHSNSSLKRRSKKQLEDSIERALATYKREKEELDDDESLDGDFEGIEEEPKRPIQIKVGIYTPPRMSHTMWMIGSIGWSLLPCPGQRDHDSPTLVGLGSEAENVQHGAVHYERLILFGRTTIL